MNINIYQILKGYLRHTRHRLYAVPIILLAVVSLAAVGLRSDPQALHSPAPNDISQYLADGPLYPWYMENGAWQVDSLFFERIHDGLILRRHYPQLNDFQNGLLYFTLGEFRKAYILLMDVRDCPVTTLYQIRLHVEADRLKWAESLALTFLNKYDDPLLSVLVLISLGDIYTRQGNPDRAISFYQKALALDADHPLAHYGIGGNYQILFNRTGNSKFSASSRHYYSQVAQNAFVRQEALLDGRYYRQILTARRFEARYHNLSMANIRRFVRRQPLPERLQTMTDIWLYYIRYIPSSDNFTDPQTSLDARRGDCSDFARYALDVLRWQRVRRHLVIRLAPEGQFVNHAFVVVFDQKNRTHYRMDVGLPKVQEVSFRDIRRRSNYYFALLDRHGNYRLRVRQNNLPVEPRQSAGRSAS